MSAVIRLLCGFNLLFARQICCECVRSLAFGFSPPFPAQIYLPLRHFISDGGFMGFVVEKKRKEGEVFEYPAGFPEWRTKPESVRMHFEVVGKVEGNKVVPESVVQINPVIAEDTVAENVVRGNISMSKVPLVYQPPSSFAI